MCAAAFTPNPIRSVKRRVGMISIIFTMIGILMSLLYLLNTILILALEIVDEADSYDFVFFGAGAFFVLLVFIFMGYILLLGSYFVLGGSLFKLKDISSGDPNLARITGILMLVGACIEVVGQSTQGTNSADNFTTGHFIILVASLFYIASFVLLFRIMRSMKREGIITKGVTPILIGSGLVFAVERIIIIILTYSNNTDFITMTLVDNIFSIVHLGLLSAGMFLLYKAIDSMVDPALQQPVQNQPDQSKFCPECGAKVNKEDAFCSSCGKTF